MSALNHPAILRRFYAKPVRKIAVALKGRRFYAKRVKWTRDLPQNLRTPLQGLAARPRSTPSPDPRP